MLKVAAIATKMTVISGSLIHSVSMFQALFDLVRSTVWAIIVSVTIYGVFDINKNYANQKCSSL